MPCLPAVPEHARWDRACTEHMDEYEPRAHAWLPDLMIAKDPSGNEYEIFRDHEKPSAMTCRGGWTFRLRPGGWAFRLRPGGSDRESRRSVTASSTKVDHAGLGLGRSVARISMIAKDPSGDRHKILRDQGI